ncbi:deoxyribonuclease-2-alpha-like [Perca fluviatilis]|uniref:deoxyribonuclease-2-alpha-like n=1 Tax=Perca fluviatilis TaxID=8168 RepID=UPI0019644EAD|nr:deoxyribonuclease-2-alpha-like [Perca fluviatilis]
MWRILLMVSLLCWTADGQRVTCKDHTGRDGVTVDWYIIYKAPKDPEKPKVPNPKEGLEYLYIDSAGKKELYKFINHPEGALANTLRPILKPIKSMTDDFGFISYSDQPPGCNAQDKFGHSKGVVMMDKTTGVWLSHSTPQFPFKRDQNNFWPDSGATNAQTFICVTFNYNQFQYIGQHLLDIAAFPFDHYLPDGFHKELIDVTEKNLKKRPKRDANKFKFQELTSTGRTLFYSIAKQQYKGLSTADARRKDCNNPKQFVGDLYQTIANIYETDVGVQTWGLQSDSFYDGKHQVDRIKSVKIAGLGGWPNTKDHSKWCIGKTNNLICIADVNRAYTQYERPGGALCFIHKGARDLFKDLINQTEPCSNPPPSDCRMDIESESELSGMDE